MTRAGGLKIACVAEDERIAERHLGELERMPIRPRDPRLAVDLALAPTGGESYLALTRRCLSFLLDVRRLAAALGRPLSALVSTHQGPLRVLAGILEETTDPRIARGRRSATASCARRSARWLAGVRRRHAGDEHAIHAAMSQPPPRTSPGSSPCATCCRPSSSSPASSRWSSTARSTASRASRCIGVRRLDPAAQRALPRRRQRRRERDREAEARDYLDEHGHWPDEEPTRSVAPDARAVSRPGGAASRRRSAPRGQQPDQAPGREHREVAAGEARRRVVCGSKAIVQRVDERLDRQHVGERAQARRAARAGSGTKTPEMKYSGSTTAFVIAGAASSLGIARV